jgi:fatty-acid peroxygenase
MLLLTGPLAPPLVPEKSRCMPTIPRDPALDSTIALWREGYPFIWNRCRSLGSDLFRARIMGKPAVCIHGKEAARLFYDPSKFERRGAVPRRVVTSLFGKGALHTLDGEAHRSRKDAFVSLMAPESLEQLMQLTGTEWELAVARWKHQPQSVLFDDAALVLARATCKWAGLLLPESAAPRRARQLVSMVDAFGGSGPRLWLGKLGRASTERWAERAIREVRRRPSSAPAGSAIRVMADLRAPNGEPLPAKVAGVELLNVIRPTVAVITFAAHALEQHPAIRERLASGAEGDHYRDLVIQEVRRFYPFAPFVGAKVKAPFEWKGHQFEPGTLVLLDIYGMHHDPAIWASPEEFRPERFRDWQPDAFDLLPQGGGPRQGHRCPGEWITMHQVGLALHVLTRRVRFTAAPGQDLSFDLSRMPTRPRSGFVIQDVRDGSEATLPQVPCLTAQRDAVAAAANGELSGVPSRHQPSHAAE